MASMNVKMLEEFPIRSNMQQFSRANVSGRVAVGVGVFGVCDVCCQVVSCAANTNRNTRSKIVFVLPKSLWQDNIKMD